jgi:hypothetical protein
METSVLDLHVHCEISPFPLPIGSGSYWVFKRKLRPSCSRSPRLPLRDGGKSQEPEPEYQELSSSFSGPTSRDFSFILVLRLGTAGMADVEAVAVD